jgi:hypothetical protein
MLGQSNCPDKHPGGTGRVSFKPYRKRIASCGGRTGKQAATVGVQVVLS